LRNRARQLRARLDKVRGELAELEESGKGESERARALRAELRELEGAMANLERELHELEGDRRQREMRPGVGQEPLPEILRRLDELGGETEMVLQRLAEQNIGRNDEANMLYMRMRELNEQMRQVRQQLGRQLTGPGRQRREFRREVPSEKKIVYMEELRKKLEVGREVDRRGLQEHAHELERRLQEIGDSSPEEARELRMRLDQIHQRMERLEREPGIPKQPRPRVEEPMRPGIELRRKELMARREQLRAQLRETELMLGELNEQGKAESEEARLHQQELCKLRELLRDTERRLQGVGRDRPQVRERDELEREVQNLRRQMNGINEQMSELRELIKRLLEKSGSSEAG